MRLSTVLLLLTSMIAVPASGETLRPETAAAFEHYAHAAEAQRDRDLGAGQFLMLDRLSTTERRAAYLRLRRGETLVLPIQTLEAGRPIHLDGGLIHHWVGVIFIPGSTLSQVTAEVEDYDKDQNIFKPDIRKSKLLSHDGDDFKVFLQFSYKEMITVVLNGSFDVNYFRLGDTRGLIRSYSTRIAEVHNPYKRGERELPVGDDRGFMWRLYSYWRVEQKDGGTYLEVELISLSRSIPPMLEPMVNPIVQSVSKRFVNRLLNGTRLAVIGTRVAPVNVLPEK